MITYVRNQFLIGLISGKSDLLPALKYGVFWLNCYKITIDAEDLHYLKTLQGKVEREKQNAMLDLMVARYVHTQTQQRRKNTCDTFSHYSP